MGNIFNSDFRDFIAALNHSGVSYMLVGGYSVVLHGYNRTTGDLGVWVQPTSDNYTKLMLAFEQFGLPQTAISEKNFLSSQVDVFTFGRPPVCIDIMTTVKGLNFEEAYSHSADVEAEGLAIRLIHLNDLLIAKKAANRFKDLDDIEHLNGY